LDNKVFDITDARCNHDVHVYLKSKTTILVPQPIGRKKD